MYIVRVGNTKIYDPRIEELALIDPVVELEENSAGSFSFTIPPTHPEYDLIQKRKSVIQVFQDDELIFSGMAIETEVDFFKQKKVVCEGELAYLNDSVQRPARYQNISVRRLLEAYINNHNAQVEDEKKFTVGTVTVTDSNNSLYCYSNMESTMQCLKEDLCDDLGGYFRIRHANGVKYIDYLADSIHTCSQVIRLGENLIDFKSNIDSMDIATAIIPLGATAETSPVEGLEVRIDIKSVNNGLDYVCSQTAIRNFGWIYKTVVWDDVTLPANLKSKGQKYLSDVQFENMIIEAKAVDLHFVDASEERFRVSDQIRVVSAPHDLNRNFRLTKQTINLNNPEKDMITLGKEERLSLSAKTSQANSDAMKAMRSIVPTSTVLKLAKDNATALITSAMGGYVVMQDTNNDGHPDEILIMDTDSTETATKVWRWNSNGLGYSNTGYNGNYGLAMTIDGAIVADYITSGTLDSAVISANSIDAAKLTFTPTDSSNIVATINASSEGATISANKITLDGNVVMKSNLTDGSTSISGSNIDTGTIDANNVSVVNVKAASVDAENITGSTISGKSLEGCTLKTATGADYVDVKNGDVFGGSSAGQHGYLTFSTLDGYQKGVALQGEDFINLNSKAINLNGTIKTGGQTGIDKVVSIPNVYVDGAMRSAAALTFTNGILTNVSY